MLSPDVMLEWDKGVFPPFSFILIFSFVLRLTLILKAPIIRGREPAATDEEKKIGAERSAELSVNVNQVMHVIEILLCTFRELYYLPIASEVVIQLDD